MQERKQGEEGIRIGGTCNCGLLCDRADFNAACHADLLAHRSRGYPARLETNAHDQHSARRRSGNLGGVYNVGPSVLQSLSNGFRLVMRRFDGLLHWTCRRRLPSAAVGETFGASACRCRGRIGIRCDRTDSVCLFDPLAHTLDQCAQLN